MNTKTRLRLLSFIILGFFSTNGDLSATDTSKFFIAKADIQIDQNGNQESFTAHIRYKILDTLWISFTGPLGIEGGRMLVTKDSTYIINKMDKTAYRTSNLEGNIYFPIALDLYDWSMILLNKVYPIDSSTLVSELNELKCLTYYYPIYTKSLLVTKSENISQAIFRLGNYNCQIAFSNYLNTNQSNQLAKRRRLHVKSELDNTIIDLEYIHFEYDKIVSLPFDFSKYSKHQNED